MALDLGGVGKEYAVDRVVQLAAQQGLPGVLVDFGADVRVQGLPGDGRGFWHVGLQDPVQTGRCWAGVAANNMGVATSGDYVRCFESGGQRFSHILDVRSGRPIANGCRGVTVLAPSCLMAGAIATAALVLGPEEGLRLIESGFGIEGCITTDTGRISSRRFYEHVVS
jgi:thiamine biosynthesis lipoprotein